MNGFLDRAAIQLYNISSEKLKRGGLMAFEKLTAYLDQLDQHGIPARDLVIYRDHELVYRHFSGVSDGAGKVPVQGKEHYLLYSCTKVFTTCCMMQLIGQGKIGLDDPVSDYLPAYADLKVRDGAIFRPAKKIMTIRHLMSMQGGLDYDMEFAMRLVVPHVPKGEATTRQMIDALALKPLSFDPGTDWQYSLCHDVLGAVIEVVSGKKLSEYMKENIFDPLGISGLTFHPDEDTVKNLCAQYQYHGQDQSFELLHEQDEEDPAPLYESGGGGLIGNVSDCIRFADAIACGGKGWNGAEILAPSLIQLWRANQLCPKGRQSFDHWNRHGYSYALGVRTRVDTEKGGRGPVGEFGWDGAAGAWMMIDPEHHLSAFYAQHVRGYGYSYDVVHPDLRNLIYEALEL